MSSENNRTAVGQEKPRVHKASTADTSRQLLSGSRSPRTVADHIKRLLCDKSSHSSSIELKSFSKSVTYPPRLHVDVSAGASSEHGQITQNSYDPLKYTDKQSCSGDGTKLGGTGKEKDNGNAYNGSISFSIKFKTSDGGSFPSPTKFTKTVSIAQYMKWRFFLNSPRQMDVCKHKVCIDIPNITFSNDCLVAGYPYVGQKKLQLVAQDVVNYAVNELGEVLTVETIILNKQDTTELNKLFGEEIAYAEKINNEVYIVYRSSHREYVKKAASENFTFNAIRNEKEVTEELHSAYKYFHAEILDEMNKNNPKTKIESIEVDGKLHFTLKGTTHDVDSALQLLRSYEVRCLDVSFPPTIVQTLKTVDVEELLNNCLKKKYPLCKAVQTIQEVKVFALNTSHCQNDLDQAVLYVSNLLTLKEIKLEATFLTQNAKAVAYQIGKRYKDRVFVKLDTEQQLNLFGLRKYVDEIPTLLVDIKEGRTTIETYVEDMQLGGSAKHTNECGMRSEYPGQQTNDTNESKKTTPQANHKGDKTNKTKSHQLQISDQKETALAGEVDQQDSTPRTPDANGTIFEKHQKREQSTVSLLLSKQKRNTIPTKNQEQEETSVFAEKNCQKKSRSEPSDNNIPSQQPQKSIYEIREISQQYFIEKYDISAEISNCFKVKIILMENGHKLLIEGPNENVRLAFEQLDTLLKKMVTVSDDLSLDQVVDYFNIRQGKKYLSLAAETNHVLVEKTTSISRSIASVQISEIQDENIFKWSSDRQNVLLLTRSELDATTAAVKFKLAAVDNSKGGRFTGTRNDVFTLGIDEWTSGDWSECENLRHIFWTALSKVDEDEKESVAFRLTAVASWKFNDLTKCFVDVCVQWLMMYTNKYHKQVIIWVKEEDGFSKTQSLVSTTIEQLMKSKCDIDNLYPDVITGQLDQTKVDVLVNTTDWELTHRYGQVSKAISKTAGASLQKECAEKYPFGIKHNEIAVTGHHHLQCQEVFHISLPKLDSDTHMECFECGQLLVKECLKLASAKGHTSIAFPAIGTGNLQYPQDMVESLMFGGVEKFKDETLETHLKQVLFVIYHKDKVLYESFDKTARKIKGSGSSALKKTSKMTLKITGTMQNVQRMKLFIQQLASQVVDLPKKVKIFEYKMRNMMLTLRNDNILDADVDGIVIAVSGDLKHLDGVAVVVADSAGQQLVEECKEKVENNRGPFQGTEVVWTSPGELHSKFIFHAVWPQWESYKPITTQSLNQCKDDVRKTVRTCLNLAHEFSLSSIAFTSLCSGNFAIPCEICAEVYSEALVEFEETNTSLKEVSFWEGDSEVIKVDHTTFSVMISERGSSPWDLSHYLNNKPQSVQTENPAEIGKEIKKIPKNTGRCRPKNENMDESRQIKVPLSYTSEATGLICMFGEAYVVEIYSDNIFDIPGIDCLVCKAGEKGEPVGKIAQKLHTLIGIENIRKKVKVFESKQWNVGDAVITDVKKSPLKCIIHTVVSRSSVNVEVMYRNMLAAIYSSDVVSAALPLLGTDDTEEHTPEKVAEIFFQELLRICIVARKNELRLHLIVQDKELAQVLQNVFKRRIDSLKEPGNFSGHSEEPRSQGGTETGGEELKSAEKDHQEEDNCVICMDTLTDAKQLKCGHLFCKECIDGYFRVKQACPTCGKVCGIICGDQPDGKMHVRKVMLTLSGFKGSSAIAITYEFKEGHQGAEHPRPGTPYKGISRTAYLPDNREGREICAMLAVAFERRLVFTIGASRTTGKEGVITWNDIHHKTDPRPNTQFGYPDDTYLQRVREELGVKGVLKDDADKKLVKALKKNDFSYTFQTDSTIN